MEEVVLEVVVWTRVPRLVTVGSQAVTAAQRV